MSVPQLSTKLRIRKYPVLVKEDVLKCEIRSPAPLRSCVLQSLAFTPVAGLEQVPPQRGEEMEGLVFEERPRNFIPQTRGRSHGFNRARQTLGEQARRIDNYLLKT